MLNEHVILHCYRLWRICNSSLNSWVKVIKHYVGISHAQTQLTGTLGPDRPRHPSQLTMDSQELIKPLFQQTDRGMLIIMFWMCWTPGWYNTFGALASPMQWTCVKLLQNCWYDACVCVWLITSMTSPQLHGAKYWLVNTLLFQLQCSVGVGQPSTLS